MLLSYLLKAGAFPQQVVQTGAHSHVICPTNDSKRGGGRCSVLWKHTLLGVVSDVPFSPRGGPSPGQDILHEGCFGPGPEHCERVPWGEGGCYVALLPGAPFLPLICLGLVDLSVP